MNEMDEKNGVSMSDDVMKMCRHFKHVDVVQSMTPGQLTAFIRFRLEFLMEEMDELTDGFAEKNPEKVVDSVIDWIVVGLGTLELMGVDSQKAWNEVMRSNMLKISGKNPDRPNSLGLPDLFKPEGWTPPSHEGNIGKIGLALRGE